MNVLPIRCHRRTIARLRLWSIFLMGFAAARADAQRFSPCGAPDLPTMNPVTIAGSDPSAVLENLYRNVTDEGASGVAVLAMQNGKVLFKGTYGLANRQNHTM
jgi:CubicO group peptidase (beta-lactamase class C family)